MSSIGVFVKKHILLGFSKSKNLLNFLSDFLFGTLSLSTPLTFCEIRGALFRSSSFCDQR